MTLTTYCPVCGCRLIPTREGSMCSALCDRWRKDGER